MEKWAGIRPGPLALGSHRRCSCWGGAALEWGLCSTRGLELEEGQAERKAWGDHKHQVR